MERVVENKLHVVIEARTQTVPFSERKNDALIKGAFPSERLLSGSPSYGRQSSQCKVRARIYYHRWPVALLGTE